jgi:hypothetical protein
VEGRRGGLSAVRGVSNSNNPDNSDFRGGASELALDLSPAEGVREMLKGGCFSAAFATRQVARPII